MAYANFVAEDRRLSLLLVLKETSGYSTNAFLLRDAVQSIYGHNASLDQVRNDLTWMAEQGLMTVIDLAGVMLAHLNAHGLDVAEGRAKVLGVKRPTPA